MGDYHKNTGTCQTPVNPLPGAEYFPFTPVCFKGCIPEGADLGTAGFVGLVSCTETAQPGTVVAANYEGQDDFARCVRYRPTVERFAFVRSSDATNSRIFDLHITFTSPSHAFYMTLHDPP